MEFGPIELDPQVRTTLDNIIGTGGTKFPIVLSDKNGQEIEGNGSMLISFDKVKVEYFFAKM